MPQGARAGHATGRRWPQALTVVGLTLLVLVTVWLVILVA
jgi:hypothetical protein